MLLGGQVRELHHNRRTYGEDFIDMFLLDKFLDTNSYYTFFAVTAVVGHDNNLVRTFAYLVFQDNQVL